MNPLSEFVNQLITDQGVSANAEVRAQLAADLTNAATDLVNRRLIDSMGEAAVNRFNVLLDGDPSADDVQRFVEQNVPNRDQVTADALTEFRKLYLGPKA